MHNLLSIDNLDKREQWRALILDFSCTPWIDSTAATALLEAVKTVQAAHGEAHDCGCSRWPAASNRGVVPQATPWRSATPTRSA